MEPTSNEYKQQQYSELWEKLGCFFAFSNTQVAEGIKKTGADPSTRFVNVGAGLLCPAEKVKELLSGMTQIEADWIDARKGKQEIKLKFVGIDDWNRPVWKDPDHPIYFGSVTELFSWGEPEEKVLEKVTISDLCYFGTNFGCEPMGTEVPAKYYL